MLENVFFSDFSRNFRVYTYIQVSFTHVCKYLNQSKKNRRIEWKIFQGCFKNKKEKKNTRTRRDWVITQFKIQFLLTFTGCRKVLGKMPADELFAKVLRSLETWVLVNKNLCRKLFSSSESPTTFNESFKVTSVPFFIQDFNSLSCDLDNFTFQGLY